jgi:hypothetical protein
MVLPEARAHVRDLATTGSLAPDIVASAVVEGPMSDVDLHEG